MGFESVPQIPGYRTLNFLLSWPSCALISGTHILGYTLKRHLRRRFAVEPEIGHMKADGLLGRNFLKDMQGDAVNAFLCGAGHNLQKKCLRLSVWRLSPLPWPGSGL